MTSSKNAVSLLTAAALVVAPVGGVAANYKTAHADEGEGDDGHVREADETQEGKTLADVEYAKANGEYSSEADYAKDVQEALGNEAAPEEAPAPEESAESDGVGDGATEGEDTGEAAPEGSEGTPEGTLPPVDQNKPVEGEGEGEGTTKFEMPNLVDKSLEAAKSILAEAHLNLSDDIQYEFSAAPKGTVLSTNPAAGTTVNAGDTVQLVVSKGTEKVAVPDFKNMTLEEAMAALDPSCLTLSSEKPVYEFSDTVEAGRVIATSPAAGTVVDNGADMTMIVSGILLKKAVDAAAALKEQGINVRVLDMATIKPLDSEAVLKAAKETGAIMTIEDHTIFGGLGSAVSEVVVQNCPVPMEIVGIQDRFGESGDPELLYRDHGMDTESIIAKAKALIARK